MKLENNMLYKLGVLLLLAVATSSTHASESSIDHAVRGKVVNAIASQLEAEYVFPDVGKKMASTLRAYEKKGEYSSIINGSALSQLITKHLREISSDNHIVVTFDMDQPSIDFGAGSENLAALPSKKSFDFVKNTGLPGNVALVELNSFPAPEIGDDAITKVMNEIADTNALIIDLRNNGGGSPDMVALISSYLFGETPVHLNDLSYRRSAMSREFWTKKSIVGKRYGFAKPVYVLTSDRTFSAAEEFSYNLKILKRATIIGATTGGGANPGETFKIDENFSIFIPMGRAINPITNTNWEGVGVTPDIEVSSNQALAVAQALALERLNSSIPTK
jgi:C-terminal processing protease CtpA/Prc